MIVHFYLSGKLISVVDIKVIPRVGEYVSIQDNQERLLAGAIHQWINAPVKEISYKIDGLLQRITIDL